MFRDHCATARIPHRSEENRSLTLCNQTQRAHEQGTGYYASIAKLLSRDDGNDYGFS